MSGRHSNKRKAKKTAKPPATHVTVKESRCQEHPDDRTENDMEEITNNSKGFIELLKDKVFDTAAAAVFISVLALVAYFWQACIMRTAMRVDQRAWISLSKISNSGKFASGESFAVGAAYKNIGKTPAKNVYASVTIEPRVQGEEPRFERDTSNAVSIGTMVPNSDYYGSVILTTCHLEGGNGERGPDFTCPLTDEEFRDVQNGSQTVYIHGRVSYEDVFDHPHWFRFCYNLLPHSSEWALCNKGSLIGQQIDDDNQ
jgi:hypothetical protein